MARPEDDEIAEIVSYYRNTSQIRRMRPSTRFTRSLAFWAPRRFVSESGIDVDGFLADLEDKIRSRGMVTFDRQIVTTFLDGAEVIESIFEPSEPDLPFPAPERCEWGDIQRNYFQLHHPYQMAEEAGDFTYSHLIVTVAEPFLSPGELISGLVHGVTDRRYYECTCHEAAVVYTTRRRLVCMSCGFTHVVLSEPLSMQSRQLLTSDEWVAYFDPEGGQRDQEVDLAIVDFCEVENASFIWQTDRWDEASHELIFFARSSEKEIWEAIRGTEMDPTIFMEAGWTPEVSAPPPAFHISNSSIDVDSLQIAAFAFREGVNDFLSAYVHPRRLLSAVPELFRSVELVLKVRLGQLDAGAVKDRPNSQRILSRLQERGVMVMPGAVATIASLRRMRNDLQHNSATFNNRRAIRVCREAIVFLDRFTHMELGLWIGDAIAGGDWQQLLKIPEIAATAENVVNDRMESFRRSSDAEITTCPQCSHDTMVRPHPTTGAACRFCGHIPIHPMD